MSSTKDKLTVSAISEPEKTKLLHSNFFKAWYDRSMEEHKAWLKAQEAAEQFKTTLEALLK